MTTNDTVIFCFDVESIGLGGLPFWVGYVVRSRHKILEVGEWAAELESIHDRSKDSQWVKRIYFEVMGDPTPSGK